MATYQTRHLEATREISHGDQFLKPGDAFEASEIDAEHYIRTGRAKAATAPAPAPAAAAKAAGKGAAAAKPATSARAPRAAALTPIHSTETAAPPPVVEVFQIDPSTASPSGPAEESAQAEGASEPMKLADVPHSDAATPAEG